MPQAIDREIEQYRHLLEPPGEYVDAFNWRTIIGMFFVALVMMPASAYLELMTGQTLGPAAEWVTIILFAEIARRSFTTLRSQELYLLFYVAAAMVGGGVFGGYIKAAYLRTSPVTAGLGLTDQIPNWVVPPANSAALLDRTFFHPDWLWPIGLSLCSMILGRLLWISFGYTLFRLTSDLEKLPFPMAPVAVSGAMALAESSQEDSWRWRTFSIGGVLGLAFGTLYVLLPTVTGIQILPIPWIDLTTTTEALLPAATVGLSTNLGLVVTGMVLPFWMVVGGFSAAMVHLLASPLLHHFGVLTTWRPGMDAIMTEFSNYVDFYLSFTIGTLTSVALLGLYRSVRELIARRREQSPAAAGGGAGGQARHSFLAALRQTPPGRGDIPLGLSVSLALAATLATIGITCWLIHPGLIVIIFLFTFGLVYTPLMSYVQARMEGMAGVMNVDLPYLRQAVMIVSGHGRVDIWFTPFPIHNYGHSALRFREYELVGLSFRSLFKAEAIMLPVGFLASLVFWQYLWSSGDPIPSAAYPYAQKFWLRDVLSTCLWMSALTGKTAAFFAAWQPLVAGGGLLFGLTTYAALSTLGLPTLLLYGFIAGLNNLPHFTIPLLVGALVGRFHLAKKYGTRWRRYVVVLAAGFAAGMGLASMAGIGFKLLWAAAFATRPW